MYRTMTQFIGESEILTYSDLSESEQSDFDYAKESGFIKDTHGKVYCLADFMRSDADKWYDGYMSSSMDSQYLIKFNKMNDSVRIFFQYQIYIPEKVAKATSKG